jgi:N-acyl-D-aspartate/D-glutamate deacylase
MTSRNYSKWLQPAIVALVLLPLLSSSLRSQEADIAIVNGRVMDPASGLDAVRTVVITGDRITDITDQTVRARRTIDARELVVSPGFVDILAHLRPAHESQRYKIKDGVTTVISMHGGPVDIAGWYARFEGTALINYGTAVGHPQVRAAAGATDDYQPATPSQRGAMREIAARAIREGAVGVGFGINYTPGASYEEVVDLFDVAARQGVPAHVHSRYKGSVFPETIVQAVQEVIAAAAVTGAKAQVVHLASSAIGSIEASLDMIAGARRNGIDIMTDMHPYLANSTRLESALYDPGWEERFGGATVDSIMLVETGERLNDSTFAYWRERGATIVTFFIPEEEVLMGLEHPLMMVTSDGVIVNGKGHPRGAGTFSRVLGRFVRERGHLTLMEALRKMTIMPAERVEEGAPSMRLRGRLAPGAYADVTIFDPNTIIDRATYLNSGQYSEGVHYVIANGTVVLDSGEFVDGTAPGRPILSEWKENEGPER